MLLMKKLRQMKKGDVGAAETGDHLPLTSICLEEQKPVTIDCCQASA